MIGSEGVRLSQSTTSTPLVFLTVVPLQLPAQAGQHRTCLAQKTVEAYNLIKVRRRSVSLVCLTRALCAAPSHELVLLTAYVRSLHVTVCHSRCAWWEIRSATHRRRPSPHQTGSAFVTR